MLSRFIFIGFQKSEKHEDQDFNETLEKTKSKSAAKKPAETPTKSANSKHKTKSAHTPSKSQPSEDSKQSPATVIKEKKSKSTTPKTKDKYSALPLSDDGPKKATTPRSQARKLQEETPDQADATPSKKTRAETPSKKSSSQTSTRSGGVRSVTPSNSSPEDTKACKTKTKKIEKQYGTASSP